MKFEIIVGWRTPPSIDDCMFMKWLIGVNFDGGGAATLTTVCLLGFYLQFYISKFWSSNGK